MRTLFVTLLLIGLVGGTVVLYGQYNNGAPQSSGFRTAKIKRGDLLVTVTATGPVAPEEIVDVGAQVVGRIQRLGEDPRGETDARYKGKNIDYRSEVKKDMILAVIDPSVYQAQRDQAAAAVARAKADLLQMEAKATQTKAEWVRAQKLRELQLPSLSPTGRQGSSVPIRGISDADFIMAEANAKVAQANVEVAKATVEQQESALRLAQTNLDYTIIYSPVDGTIIERRVNIGQTVVSSMNAPSLFLIAEDLRRMQVWASVSEADIGRLKVGMPVHFTVDAFPEDEFHGEVYQIRLNATSNQNVVTYTVVVSVDNSDLKLLPYLTANVRFEIERHSDVLVVPNAALRFEPLPTQVRQPAVEDADPAEGRGKRGDAGGDQKGTIWVQDGEFLAPIEVTVEANDGAFSEVVGEGIEDGLEVVIGQQRKEASSSSEVNNPFAPPKWRGGKRRG